MDFRDIWDKWDDAGNFSGVFSKAKDCGVFAGQHGNTRIFFTESYIFYY
jgi:hypothetical protein